MKRLIIFILASLQLSSGVIGQSKMILSFGGTFEPLDAWEKPDPRLRLDQVAYLGAHNAYANVQEGFVYAQQFWSLTNQLNHGIRHLLLDIWPYNGQLLLCHNHCPISTILKLGGKNKTLQSALIVIKNWLDEHPDELLTLELENYATGLQTYEVITSVPGLEAYILKHTDYEPLQYKGEWPTLEYLIKINKRLIIFDTKDNSHYAFYSYSYLMRNMFGALNIERAARPRPPQEPNRTLYQLNYFGTITSPSPYYNEPARLKLLLKKCQENGVVPEGKCPNFLAIDFSDRGNAMRWVNELNREAAKKYEKAASLGVKEALES